MISHSHKNKLQSPQKFNRKMKNQRMILKLLKNRKSHLEKGIKAKIKEIKIKIKKCNPNKEIQKIDQYLKTKNKKIIFKMMSQRFKIIKKEGIFQKSTLLTLRNQIKI